MTDWIIKEKGVIENVFMHDFTNGLSQNEYSPMNVMNNLSLLHIGYSLRNLRKIKVAFTYRFASVFACLLFVFVFVFVFLLVGSINWFLLTLTDFTAWNNI